MLQNFVCHLDVVALADTDGRENRRAGEGRHFDRHVAGLADGDGRCAKQALVEEGVGLLLLGGADDKIGEALELLRERAQQRRGEDIEDRVHGRNANGVDRRGHKGEMEDGVQPVEQAQAHHRADEVERDVHDGDLAGVLVDADGRDERRDAGADVLTHDDRDGDAIGDLARGSQRLQNADGGGGGLDHARDDRADEHAEQRVLKRRQDARKGLGILQTGNGASHERHAVHQNGEADHDLADVALAGLFAHHDEHNADKRDDRGEILRLEQLDPARAVHAGQRQDPRRERRADVRAHDDADRLPELHDAGVDQTDEHDRHGGRGLDGDGDDRAECHAREAVLRHRFEGALQRAACQFSQSAGHHVHAIEEERKPAEQSEDLQKHCHRETLYFLSVFGKVRPYRTNYTISQKTEHVKAHFPEFRIQSFLRAQSRRSPAGSAP